MEHVNFNQLTLTPSVYEKKRLIMNKTKLAYMRNATTRRPARTTGSNHMHLTLGNVSN
jgi:hypothetical protein